MKQFLLTLIFLLFCSPLWAVEIDFSSGSDAASTAVLADDGKCVDEINEYDRLIGITSASDEDKATALTKRDEAISKRLTGRQEECETLMQEALVLIPE